MKKKNFKLSIIISLFVVISLSITYAFMELNATNTTGTGEGGCFEVNYTGQEINNSSLQSTVDYTQGATSNIVLSKNANCEIYTEASIYIHTNSDTTAPISDGALKFKVMQGTTELGTGSITTVGDTLLADNIPLTETNTTYTVYLWIDPEISRGAYHQKNYSGYLYANSTQSSSVTS